MVCSVDPTPGNRHDSISRELLPAFGTEVRTLLK